MQQINETTIETLKMLLEDICSLAERSDSDEAIEIQDLAGKALEVLAHQDNYFVSNEDALYFNSDELWAEEDLQGFDEDEREI